MANKENQNNKVAIERNKNKNDGKTMFDEKENRKRRKTAAVVAKTTQEAKHKRKHSLVATANDDCFLPPISLGHASQATQ